MKEHRNINKLKRERFKTIAVNIAVFVLFTFPEIISFLK